MEGLHFESGAWSGMLHGFAFGVFTDVDGPRGGTQLFSTNMLMAGVARPLGRGTFGLRAMVSLEPLMGSSGYRLLLQTGESGNGTTHLLDRQHPHDLFMEIATTYSVKVGGASSAFIYAGFPGEPALGPPAFMHRASALINPLAPLGHHWLDSTHISFGVVTAGATWKAIKLDGSLFNGREPDGRRWNFERLRLDSQSARVTVNPTRSLSVQASTGWLKSPERLHPGLDEQRRTLSASWSPSVGRGSADVTLAWGRKIRSADLPNCFVSAGCYTASIPYPPNRVQDALLLEVSYGPGPNHRVFFRGERVEKDELFPGVDPFHARVFPVGSAVLGYLRELKKRGPVGLRIGGALGLGFVPSFIAPDYGGRRVPSVWLLAEARLR